MNLFKTTPRACTSCCPFDIQNLPHPQMNSSSSIGNQITTNSDTCCLNKLQVNCRVQCKKKKKKKKEYNSSRSISSASQFSDNRKRKKKFIANTNSCYYDDDDETSSSNSEVSFKQKKSVRMMDDKNKILIQDLKKSIDNLTQLVVQHQNSSSISLIDRFRRFFTSSSGDRMNEECGQILERNQLTKQNLLDVYQLFDKNETIFLNWLRTIMPESILPLLLKYVKYLDNK